MNEWLALVSHPKQIIEVRLGAIQVITLIICFNQREQLIVLAVVLVKIFFFLQVQQPIVCGISSLGYDHMEILGQFLDP